MSALLIDLPLAELPAATTPRRWMHVVPEPAEVPAAPAPRPAARQAAPAVRPAVQPAPRPAHARTAPAPAPLRLTRRGLAVVVGGFTLLMMTALVVLVASFLAVSNDPIVAQLPLH